MASMISIPEVGLIYESSLCDIAMILKERGENKCSEGNRKFRKCGSKMKAKTKCVFCHWAFFLASA